MTINLAMDPGRDKRYASKCEGELRLWEAVIGSAVSDLTNSNSRVTSHHRSSARRFLFGSASPLVWIAAGLDIDVGRLREAVRWKLRRNAREREWREYAAVRRLGAGACR